MAVIQIGLGGDSLTAGKVSAYDWAQEGSGAWWERMASMLCAHPSLGPRISAGIRLCETAASGVSAGEWSRTGTPTAVTSADAYDKFPYEHGAVFTNTTAGSHLYTYTKPPWMPECHGVAIYFVDVGGDFQYRTDANAFASTGQSITGSNNIVVFYATGDFSTIDFRGWNGSAGVACYPFGVEPYFLPPSTADGCIVHNWAIGGSRLSRLVAATAGDRMAFLDSVVQGTGSPIVPNFDYVFLGQLNDVVNNDVPAWASNLTTFEARATAGGATLALFSPFEASVATYPAATQEAYRDQTKTSAAAFSPAVTVFDWYDEYEAEGIVGNDDMVTAGLLDADKIHGSARHHADMGERMYLFARDSVLQLTDKPVTSIAAGVAARSFVGRVAQASHVAGSPLILP